MGELLQVDDVLLALRLVEPELLSRARAAAPGVACGTRDRFDTAVPGREPEQDEVQRDGDEDRQTANAVRLMT